MSYCHIRFHTWWLDSFCFTKNALSNRTDCVRVEWAPKNGMYIEFNGENISKTRIVVSSPPLIIAFAGSKAISRPQRRSLFTILFIICTYYMLLCFLPFKSFTSNCKNKFYTLCYVFIAWYYNTDKNLWFRYPYPFSYLISDHFISA